MRSKESNYCNSVLSTYRALRLKNSLEKRSFRNFNAHLFMERSLHSIPIAFFMPLPLQPLIQQPARAPIRNIHIFRCFYLNKPFKIKGAMAINMMIPPMASIVLKFDTFFAQAPQSLTGIFLDPKLPRALL